MLKGCQVPLLRGNFTDLNISVNKWGRSQCLSPLGNNLQWLPVPSESRSLLWFTDPRTFKPHLLSCRIPPALLPCMPTEAFTPVSICQACVRHCPGHWRSRRALVPAFKVVPRCCSNEWFFGIPLVRFTPYNVSPTKQTLIDPSKPNSGTPFKNPSFSPNHQTPSPQCLQ